MYLKGDRTVYMLTNTQLEPTNVGRFVAARRLGSIYPIVQSISSFLYMITLSVTAYCFRFSTLIDEKA